MWRDDLVEYDTLEEKRMDRVDWRDLAEIDWPARNHLKRRTWRLQRLGRWIRRNPGWTAFVVICGLIAGLLAAVGRGL